MIEAAHVARRKGSARLRDPTARGSAHVPGGHTCRTPQRMSSPSDRQPAARPDDRGKVVNPIKALQGFGQSVWLDYLRRSLFTSGEFTPPDQGGRAARRHLQSVDLRKGDRRQHRLPRRACRTSNGARDLEPMALYEALAIRDIREAADLLRPVYDATGRADGYVSLEVSPYLAHDTAATIEDARRLWKAVGRDNLMIKVPAHGRRRAGDSPTDQRGRQRQHHPALRHRPVRRRRDGVHRGPLHVRGARR